MRENALFEALEDAVVEDIGALPVPQKITLILVEVCETLLEVGEKFHQQEANFGFFVRQKPLCQLLVVLFQWLDSILALLDWVVRAFARLKLEVGGVEGRYFLDTVSQHLFLDV